MSFLKGVSQTGFVFDLQQTIFGCFWGSQLQFWRKSRSNASFWASKLHFWTKSRRKAWFLSFKAYFFKKSRTNDCFDTNHLNHTSVDRKSPKPQIFRHPSNLNFKSVGNQVSSILNRLTTKSVEKNQLKTKSIESQISWQQKSFDFKIKWKPHELTLNSFASDINLLSNHLNSAYSFPTSSLCRRQNIGHPMPTWTHLQVPHYPNETPWKSEDAAKQQSGHSTRGFWKWKTPELLRNNTWTVYCVRNRFGLVCKVVSCSSCLHSFSSSLSSSSPAKRSVRYAKNKCQKQHQKKLEEFSDNGKFTGENISAEISSEFPFLVVAKFFSKKY